jgi:nucleoside-diphosphate-sugar epimerase
LGPTLLVGGEGFTGQVLAKRMREQGLEVVTSSRQAGASDIQADLLDPASLVSMVQAVKPATVVHLAGFSFAADRNFPIVYGANVVGTANLLRALEAHPPRLAIVASSASVYAPSQGEPIAEDHALAPINHYAASKIAVEQMCALATEICPIQVVRPFNYTGPEQSDRFLIPKIVRHFASGAESIVLGNLDLFRDISSVEDIAESYIRLVRRGAAEGPLNICSGTTVHLAQVIDLLQEISGRSLTVRRDEALVRAGESTTIVGSRARLEAAIGTWDLEPLRSLLVRMYTSAAAQPN